MLFSICVSMDFSFSAGLILGAVPVSSLFQNILSVLDMIRLKNQMKNLQIFNTRDIGVKIRKRIEQKHSSSLFF